jgi:predicted small secreted protein
MKHNGRTIAALALIAAAALTLGGCDNTFGVFHEIQTETKQVGTDIFLNATVKGLGEDAVNYYAVMSKLYVRAKSGDTWTVLPVNATSDYYCAGFASDNASTIYAAVTESASSSALKGIYSSTNQGADWTELTATGLGSSIVDSLFLADDGTANGTLFVAAHTETEAASTYALYYWNGSAFVTAGLSNLNRPITAVAYAQSNYWAIGSDAEDADDDHVGRLYKGAALGTLTADSAASTPSGAEVIDNFTVNAAGNLLVTTADGDLYTWDGAAWTTAVVAADVKLGALAQVPKVPAGTDYCLIIPKHDSTYGYYEYESTKRYGNASDAVFVPTSSNYTTAIYEKPVQAIYYSEDKDTILIAMAAQGTDGYALYSNTYASGAWGGWNAE